MSRTFFDTDDRTFSDTDDRTFFDTEGSPEISWVVAEEEGIGSFSSLALALANPSLAQGQLIQIQGLWENDDTANCSVDVEDITVQAMGPSKIKIGEIATPSHFRLRCATIGSHCIEVNAPGFILNGVEVCQESSSGDDKCILKTVGGALTVNDSFLWSSGVDGQDGIYCEHNGDYSVNLENTVFFNLARTGLLLDSWQTSGTKTISLAINSCLFFECGTFVSDYSAAVGVRNKFSSTTFTVDVFNSDFLQSAGYCLREVLSTELITFNIHNSISSDTTIGLDAAAYGCLPERTATDDRSAATGDYVIFKKTDSPPDLRLYRSDENDAFNMHSDGSGAGLVMPATDISGNTRTAPYTCGPSEIVFIEPELYISKTESPTFSYSINDDGVLVQIETTIDETGGTVESEVFTAYVTATRAFRRVRVLPEGSDERITWVFSLDGTTWTQGYIELSSVVASSVTEVQIKLIVNNSSGAFTDPGGGSMSITEVALAVKGIY